MKDLKQTFQITFVSILTLTLSGCAALRSIPFLGGSAAEEAAEENADPIAAAAERFRQPAFSEENSFDARARSPRANAPAPESITTGMSMEEVRQAWGSPRNVETAGDFREGNQRWTYYQGLSSRWSVSPTRVVYFERGQVAGWENGR